MTDWIATHTKYSLNPPRLRGGEDPVEQFLFEDQRGFCEQIASSLVVMLRAAGIPTRLTVGYAPGKRNPFSGLYEVRASDAHSYAEVLFPGIGWQAFDPTADVPLAGEAGAFPASAAAGLSKWVADRLPTQEQATAAAAVVIALATVVSTLRVVRRRRARTWLDAQLLKLERHAGVPIEQSATLPAWLARLPDAERPRYERIVAALEQEAWSSEPLDDDTRRSVAHALGR
jgi:hypothetical protein